MLSVLLTAFSFMLIILIGFSVKTLHIFPENSGDVMKKVLINLTLPCAIIVNFSKNDSVGNEMLIITILGILVNIIMIAAAVIMTKKSSKTIQALSIMCFPSYNIGAFCLPFVQSFLPPLGTVTACMFDVGNSIMCTGCTYAFASEYLSAKRQGFDLKAFFKRLLSSPPLVSYVLMFLLSVFHIKLPQMILTMISPIASANTFTAMLMIGLLLRFEFKKDYLSDIFRVIGARHVFAVCFALVSYFLLPFDPVIRKALVLLSFAPISAVAPAYVGMCGGDEGKASAANSISIILSVLELTILLLIMPLSA